ncbi:MAG: hypothetical protein ACRC9P_01570, partial [Bacteroides sp.]
LPHGDYRFLVWDNNKNPTLPALKYITGYLIPEISKALKKRGYNVQDDALYRFFEQKFTPEIVDTVVDEEVTYHNLKGLKTKELTKVADRIIKWSTNLNIQFEDRKFTKDPAFSEKYAEVYARMWRDTKQKYNI